MQSKKLTTHLLQVYPFTYLLHRHIPVCWSHLLRSTVPLESQLHASQVKNRLSSIRKLHGCAIIFKSA